MTRILARAAFLLITLVALFGLSRALVRALPGDPIETLIAESGTSVPPAELGRELGLDRPFLPALARDLGRALHGDFGVSLLSHKQVAPILWSRFRNTLELTLLSLALGLALSACLGLPAARDPGGLADRICTFHGALSAALPMPWIGPVLMIVFAVWIPLFPVSGSVWLPAFALALLFSGLWARLIRERVRDTLARGAAPGARARGVPEWKVLLKYGLAPCFGALAAYLGTQFGALLAGAFVTEVIFDWKGMGMLLVESVLKRDYPLVEAATFVVAAASLAGNLLGDWAQSLLEPGVSA